MRTLRSSPADSLVSVMIVSFGDSEPLRLCLEALAETAYEPFEVIVGRFAFENTDVNLTADTRFPLTVVRFKEDVGLTAARNELSKRANGRYLAFLDDDTIPRPLWLKEAIKALSRSNSIGAVQSVLLDCLDPSKIEGAGCAIDISGYPLERGRLLGILEGKNQQSVIGTQVFGASCAAMVIKREVFQEVGLFDPDFTIDLEDIDISWRVRLAGYQIRLAEKSKVVHKRQSKRSSRSRRYQEFRYFNTLKNQMLCVAKNMGSLSIIKYLPVILLSHLVKCFMPKERVSLLMMKAIYWNFKNLRVTIRKRYVIQHVLRQRSDGETLAFAIRLPILLMQILVGTGVTLRIVRSLDDRQVRAGVDNVD